MGKKKSLRTFAEAKSKRILALAPRAVGQSFKAFVQDDEPVGVIACLSINGPLSQCDDGWFENYESITERFLTAMVEPTVHSIILKFNSPGGDVAGLFETVKTMKAAKTKPVYAFVDESCYSAAYALAMVADEVYLPPAAGCGSIGVITCMVDVTGNNAEHGIRVEVITSGDQKADGHPDVPLTDEAIARTQERVDDLATMFFELVGESRGLSANTVKSYQAGIFQGSDAVAASLADGVMSWSDLVSAVSATATTTKETRMATKLQAVRDENEKAKLAASTPAAEVKFKHTKKSVEVIESEDEPSASGEDDDEEDDDEEDDKPAKKKDDAKALLALVAQLTGKKTAAGMTGALLALKESKTRESSMAARLETIEREREQDRVAALVQSGLKAGKIAPSQRAWAASMSRASLKAYLEATPSMVHIVDDEELTPAASNKRVVTKAMAEVWTKMGIKPDQFEACLANMDENIYKKLENK